MFKLLLWFLRIIYTLLCVTSLLIGGMLVVYTTFPLNPDSIIQFMAGMFIIIFGLVVIYFIVDTWRYEK